MQSEYSLQDAELTDDNVKQLIEHIWQEANGEIDNILAVSIDKLKVEQVNYCKIDSKCRT